MNIGTSEQFTLAECKDELGEIVSPVLKDFKSSDENVIRIDAEGRMSAVGKGTAVITANAYIGADNPVSVEYIVDNLYISGVTEGEISYAAGELVEDKNISGYKVKYSDGTEEEAVITEVPAAAEQAGDRYFPRMLTCL